MIRQTLPAAILAFVTCLAALLPMPASAAELVLAPAPGSSWNVNNGAENCLLRREFGEGEDRVTLLMTQWAPGGSFQMALAGQPLDRFGRGRQILVAFGEGDDLGQRASTGFAGELEGAGTALVFSNVALTRIFLEEGEEPSASRPSTFMLPPEAIAAADRIEVTQARNTLRLLPGNFPQALTVLDACSQQRMSTWGLDVAAHRTMTREVKALNLTDIARRVQSRYPRPALLRAREQGIVRLRVIVEPDGTVADCALTLASTSRTLGDGVCGIFSDTAEFEPALDATGAPMRSFFTTTIIYTTS